MYSDVENGVRFLTEVPKEGGNGAYEPSVHIDHENPPVNVVISNAESAITATNEVGILPPVDYSIASGGYVLSNMLYPGPPASVHAQAMCCNRTGNLVFWLEAITYSGAGALNISTLRIMRSKDFGRTREEAADIYVLSGTTVNGSVGISDSVFVVNPRNLCCNHDATVLVIPFKYGVGISYDLGYTYTWKRLTTAGENAFSTGQYICCSESGQYIYVIGRGSSRLYISSNAGQTFTEYPTSIYGALVSSLQAGETIIDADKEVSGLCCSRDGRMVAAVQRVGQQNGARTPNYRGKIYLSFNFGSTFLARTIYDCSMQYTWEFGGITMSESGQNIIVGHNNSLVSPDNQSRLHISTDYGATFQTLANNATTGLPSDIKYAVDRLRSNADCKHIWIQSENSRFMAYSSNYGTSWSQWTLSQDIGSRNYDGLCLSAWGDHVYYIYNSSIRRLEMLMLLSGISSASNMGFDTAGSRRMTILADGKVGINKTDPAEQLDVNGNIEMRGNLVLPDDNQRDIGTVGGNALKTINVHNAYCKAIQVHSTTGGDIGTNSKPFAGVYCGAITQPSSTVPLYLNTNASARMTITSSGNVGIGTTTPSTILDVNGTTTVRGDILPDATTSYRNIGSATQKFDGVYCYYIRNPSTTEPLIFNVNATERMRIANDGKIGISTTSPLSTLDVRGSSNISSGTNGTGSLRIGVGTGLINDYSWISFIHGNANQTDGNDRARIGAIVENGGGGNLYFTTGTAGAGQTERLRITSGGSVGVGTTSPLSLFDVSSSSINPTMTLATSNYTNNPASATTVATFRMYNDKSQGDKFCDIKAVVRASNHTPSIVFSTKLDWSNAITDRMIITEAGKVGINQASPAEVLDVVGNIKVSGNILPDTSANLRDLGSLTQRWNTLYCQTAVNTSDRQDKKEIVDLDSSQWLDIIAKLHPVSFKYVDNSSDRQHTGFISQQVVDDVGFELADKWGFYVKSGMSKRPPPVEEKSQEVIKKDEEKVVEEVGVKRKREDDLDIEEVLGEEEFKEGFVEEIVEESEDPVTAQPVEEPKIEPEREYYGLRYTELIAPLVSCVQELNKRILLQQEQIQFLSTQIAELKRESAL